MPTIDPASGSYVPPQPNANRTQNGNNPAPKKGGPVVEQDVKRNEQHDEKKGLENKKGGIIDIKA